MVVADNLEDLFKLHSYEMLCIHSLDTILLIWKMSCDEGEERYIFTSFLSDNYEYIELMQVH